KSEIIFPPWNLRSCRGRGRTPGAIASGSISSTPGKPPLSRKNRSAPDPFAVTMFNGLRIDGDLFDVLGIVLVTSCLQFCHRSIKPNLRMVLHAKIPPDLLA